MVKDGRGGKVRWRNFELALLCLSACILYNDSLPMPETASLTIWRRYQSGYFEINSEKSYRCASVRSSASFLAQCSF